MKLMEGGGGDPTHLKVMVFHVVRLSSLNNNALSCVYIKTNQREYPSGILRVLVIRQTHGARSSDVGRFQKKELVR